MLSLMGDFLPGELYFVFLFTFRFLDKSIDSGYYLFTLIT